MNIANNKYFCKRWMQSCSDIDLKKCLIANQECELQDLSNQNADLKKVLEKLNIKVDYILLLFIVLINKQKKKRKLLSIMSKEINCLVFFIEYLSY